VSCPEELFPECAFSVSVFRVDHAEISLRRSNCCPPGCDNSDFCLAITIYVLNVVLLRKSSELSNIFPLVYRTELYINIHFFLLEENNHSNSL
jgi:hypothetical protein